MPNMSRFIRSDIDEFVFFFFKILPCVKGLIYSRLYILLKHNREAERRLD